MGRDGISHLGQKHRVSCTLHPIFRLSLGVEAQKDLLFQIVGFFPNVMNIDKADFEVPALRWTAITMFAIEKFCLGI